MFRPFHKLDVPRDAAQTATRADVPSVFVDRLAQWKAFCITPQRSVAMVEFVFGRRENRRLHDDGHRVLLPAFDLVIDGERVADEAVGRLGDLLAVQIDFRHRVDAVENQIRSGGKVRGNVEIARKCPVIKLIGAQELFIGAEIRIRNDVVLHQLQFDVSGHCRLERPQRLLALPCQPPHAVQINRLHVCPFVIIYGKMRCSYLYSANVAFKRNLAHSFRTFLQNLPVCLIDLSRLNMKV